MKATQSFEEWWVSFLSRNALKKKPPGTIPVVGKQLLSRNYVSLYFTDPKTPFEFLAEDYEGKGLSGIYFQEAFGGGPIASISFRNLCGLRLEARYFYKRLEWRIVGSTHFATFHFLQLYKILYFAEVISQWFYNRRSFRTTGRTEIIEWALEIARTSTLGSGSPLEFLIHKHGRRIVSHPDRVQLTRYYRLVFDALVEEKALTRNREQYKLAPTGISILAAERLAEERHKDSVKLQKVIAVLTFFLVLTGARDFFP